MTRLGLHAKGLLVALVALMLSAGAAFAGAPTSTGLSLASSASGKTVPVDARDGQDSQDESTETDAPETETPDAPASDAADNCSTDPTGLTADQLAAMNHGSIVCWAAHQVTPDGYANHGAFVSEWAHKGKGAGSSAGSSASTHAAAGLSHKGQGKANRP